MAAGLARLLRARPSLVPVPLSRMASEPAGSPRAGGPPGGPVGGSGSPRGFPGSPRAGAPPGGPVGGSGSPRGFSGSPRAGAPPGDFATLRLQRERGGRVLHLQLHRPQKRNALNLQCWRELRECFQELSQDPSCRAIVVSGAGSAFTAGIDLSDLASLVSELPEDVARRAWALRQRVQELQESFTAMERCPKPVIAAIHGPCIGAGVDLISACDIRFCSQDASFQVKEVDMGLAADVGTLQRLPKIVGNQSLVNELAFTARVMRAPEALSCGLVSRVLPDKETLLEVALEVASAIAARSPVAVQGTKVNLVYSRDRPVSEGLHHVAVWNMAMLQTEDIPKAVQAALDKKGPEDVPFAKL